MPCLEVRPTGVITTSSRPPADAPRQAPVAYPVAIKNDDNLRDV